VRAAPLLDRNNPDTAALASHTKVTRNDWLNIARDILVNDGVAEVKILKMADRLGVSRSSFYWYFGNRQDLLDALLAEWDARNTACLIAHCETPSTNITEAACNFFRCFVNPSIFDTGLDFAVREWARRDNDLRIRIDAADAARIASVTAMFLRHDYPMAEADARARILYFMQLGYHALKVAEPMDLRMTRVGPYIVGFTGRAADPDALASFFAYIRDNNLT
jgi:AcrR family transcriptional regulator